MKYANGDIYEGFFNKGLRHGQGMYKYLNGDVYEGNWSNDKKNGRGKYIYNKDNASYDGEWIDNTKTG